MDLGQAYGGMADIGTKETKDAKSKEYKPDCHGNLETKRLPASQALLF